MKEKSMQNHHKLIQNLSGIRYFPKPKPIEALKLFQGFFF